MSPICQLLGLRGEATQTQIVPAFLPRRSERSYFYWVRAASRNSPRPLGGDKDQHMYGNVTWEKRVGKTAKTLTFGNAWICSASRKNVVQVGSKGKGPLVSQIQRRPMKRRKLTLRRPLTCTSLCLGKERGQFRAAQISNCSAPIRKNICTLCS